MRDPLLSSLGPRCAATTGQCTQQMHADCRSMYADHHGHLSLLHGLKEALWHSISHTLSIDVFKVNAFPSRLITVAYGFLVMILTNTCAPVCCARWAARTRVGFARTRLTALTIPTARLSTASSLDTKVTIRFSTLRRSARRAWRPARVVQTDAGRLQCRYTANLAAFLTVAQLDTNIQAVPDLRSRTVATVQPYVKRLYENHQLTTTDIDSARRHGPACLACSRPQLVRDLASRSKISHATRNACHCF